MYFLSITHLFSLYKNTFSPNKSSNNGAVWCPCLNLPHTSSESNNFFWNIKCLETDLLTFASHKALTLHYNHCPNVSGPLSNIRNYTQDGGGRSKSRASFLQMYCWYHCLACDMDQSFQICQTQK